MSDSMQKTPRLGRMILGDEAFEEQEAQAAAGGSLLGPLVLDNTPGSLTVDAPTGKPKRVRHRGKVKDPVSGVEVDGAAALAAAMGSTAVDGIEDDGDEGEDDGDVAEDDTTADD